MTEFTNIGHRGAAAYVRENTLASLEEAIARHADMVEFDVRRTSDGALVLFHDNAVSDSAGRPRMISNTSLAELQRLTAAVGYELATLEQAFQRLGGQIPFDIEIKVAGIEPAVLEMLRKFQPAFAPTLSSFLPWVLWRLKHLSPSHKTALILGQRRFLGVNLLSRSAIRRIASVLGIGAIHLQQDLVADPIVENLSRAGIPLYVWTVDDPVQMRSLLAFGVDGIITNKPDVLYDLCLEMANSPNPILKSIDNSHARFAYAI